MDKKLTKINTIIIALLVIEIMLSMIFMSTFNIFQHMLLVQIVPSILLAILIGRIAYGKKLYWIYIILGSIIYTALMYVLITNTPMSVIENNTVQSNTSVFEFNKNIRFITYLGFFIQEFLIASFVFLIIKVIRKIKEGRF
ncbi:hypothetical protein [Mammaliicoccus sp. Dog046]|uniref:hypothetical protein n=1 Tax=Mammaliicoccus sp. Dog046 TaxID=3034233 RepID=UPI002B262F3A|nr:hypothetical protein [Mammaliicoccus sp. Dog046]WQK85451.1 hypothetical protein P3U32_12735 [Mammaliicoccus sp. Dog046]